MKKNKFITKNKKIITKKKKIIAIILCLYMTVITISQIFIDVSTPIGNVIKIIWLATGVAATILAVINLIRSKKM